MLSNLTIPTCDRLILKELLTAFAFIFALFLAVAFILVLFTELDTLQKNNASFGMCMTYVFLSLPHQMVKATPIIVVLSTVIALGNLIRHNECLMLFLAGYSPLRLALPVGSFFLVLIVALFMFNEKVCGPFSAKADLLLLQQEPGGNVNVVGSDDLWIHGEGGQIYRAKKYYPLRKEIEGLTIFQFSGAGKILSGRLDAHKAIWDDQTGTWRLMNVVTRQIKKDGSIERDLFDTYNYGIERTPQDFNRVTQDPEEMSRAELKQLIDSIRESGETAQVYLPDLRIKEAFPFAVFFLGLLTFTLCMLYGTSGRTAGVGLGLLAAIGYFLSLSVGNNLAEIQAVSPWLGAWAPNILCFLLTIYFFVRLFKEV